jgi:hypothetical protein
MKRLKMGKLAMESFGILVSNEEVGRRVLVMKLGLTDGSTFFFLLSAPKKTIL